MIPRLRHIIYADPEYNIYSNPESNQTWHSEYVSDSKLSCSPRLQAALDAMDVEDTKRQETEKANRLLSQYEYQWEQDQ